MGRCMLPGPEAGERTTHTTRPPHRQTRGISRPLDEHTTKNSVECYTSGIQVLHMLAVYPQHERGKIVYSCS
jgi:hypothetical protein